MTCAWLDDEQVQLLPDLGVVGHLLVHCTGPEIAVWSGSSSTSQRACPLTYDPLISAARFCRRLGVTVEVSWKRDWSCPGNLA